MFSWLISATAAQGAVTYTISGTWDSDSRKAAAIASMDDAVARYNAYGTFNKNITVTYNSGVATADANYAGSLRFGGTWPNVRVAQHEIAHTLGIGTSSNWATFMTGGTWDGARGIAIVQQFDGLQATLNGDTQHIWPYGLNFDNEASTVNNLRNAAVVYAMRGDMGIGPTAYPSTATSVTLTAGDAIGESGFNYSNKWSDGHFAHAGAAYATGNFVVRTPASANSFNFVGDSLTLNNAGDPNGGLFYKGSGTTGVLTFNNLILAGGSVHHYSGNADLFQLAGKVTVSAASTINAEQGNVDVLANVTGNAGLTIGTTNGFAVRWKSAANTFTGDLTVNGRFELDAGANQKFVVGAKGTNNAIKGSGVKTLNGEFEFDLTGAGTTVGDAWTIVAPANTTYGATFAVEGFTETVPGVWSDGRYTFSEATGTLTALPEPSSLALFALSGFGLARRRRMR